MFRNQIYTLIAIHVSLCIQILNLLGNFNILFIICQAIGNTDEYNFVKNRLNRVA